MKTLWILAAAATFAACANRSDDETGAAPDRGGPHPDATHSGQEKECHGAGEEGEGEGVVLYAR